MFLLVRAHPRKMVWNRCFSPPVVYSHILFYLTCVCVYVHIRMVWRKKRAFLPCPDSLIISGYLCKLTFFPFLLCNMWESLEKEEKTV